MIREYRITMLFSLLALLLGGCANVSSKQQVLAAGSQVEVRSYQTRTYDTNNRIQVLRAVMSTLQDLRFVIDKADDIIGIVSATKLDGYAMSISVSVRPSGEQMIVRANAQYNLKAIEDPLPYQNFFTALDKGLFLENNLLSGNTETHAAAAKHATRKADVEVDSVYDFYGEAEAEVDAQSHDRDLWARALVEVEGDEPKRKARYIELRAEQLYAQNSATGQRRISTTVSRNRTRSVTPSVFATPTAFGVALNHSKPDQDLSGTYVAEITTNTHWVFQKGKHRQLVFVLEQHGDDITAIASSANLKVSGTLKDDRIVFFTWPSDVTYSEIKGKWRIVDGGNRLEGKWTHPHGNGKWNLTRLP